MRTKIDSTVRRQGRRVRDRLAEYRVEGAADPYVLTLPRGGYARSKAEVLDAGDR